MPKVINQNEALIEKLSMQVDSLSAKMQHVDTKIKILKSNNQILADSLSFLNKTLERADIKTEYFSDQLNYQLFWFSLILVALGFLSWKYIIDPIKKDIQNITTTDMPNLEQKLENALKDQFERFDTISNDLIYKVKENENDILSAFTLHSLSAKNYHFFVYYGIKSVHHSFENLKIDENDKSYFKKLKTILDRIGLDRFNTSQIIENESEIMDMLNYLICSKNSDISSISTDIKVKLRNLFDNLKVPTSAIEADPQAAEEAE